MQRLTMQRHVVRLFSVVLMAVFVIVFCAALGESWSAPSISQVQGTISNGSSVTITGTGFGATGPTVVLFDDFEKGTNNNIISTSLGSAQTGNWTETEVSPYNPKYSTAYAHSGSKGMLSDQSNFDGAHWASVDFTPSTKVYVSFWVLLPTGMEVPGTGGSGGPNWKLGDVNAGSNSSPSSQYTVAVTLQDLPASELQSPGAWYGSSGLSDGGYTSTSWSKNRWHRFEAYYIGSAGTSGENYLWELNSGTPWRNIWSQTNMHNLQSTNSSGWRLFRLHSYARQDSLGQCYYDDVYVATGTAARARVEIGNNATYSNCTNLAVITPTSWNNSQITATVRQGSFTAGQTAYLFVVDASGAASSQGFPVTIGGGGAVSPVAPENLRLSTQ